jgi:hypothetical protein
MEMMWALVTLKNNSVTSERSTAECAGLTTVAADVTDNDLVSAG